MKHTPINPRDDRIDPREPYFDGFDEWPFEYDPDADRKRYMKSNRWKIMALATKLMADCKCQSRVAPDCSGIATQVHHVTYRNLRRESPGIDTRAVCGFCHMWLHGKHPQQLAAANDNSERPDRKIA